MEVERERRRFVRHPVDVPVVVTLSGLQPHDDAAARDLGGGGICLRLQHAPPPGAEVTVSFPVLEHEWRFEGRVVWAQPADDGWDVGLVFTGAADRARARVVEQICQIEEYRREQARAGRALTTEEAAREWSARNADRFPEF